MRTKEQETTEEMYESMKMRMRMSKQIYKITHPPQHPFSCDPESCSFGRPPAGSAFAFPAATGAWGGPDSYYVSLFASCENQAHILIPPDSPDDRDKCLIHVDSLLGRCLDTLGIETLCEVSALCTLAYALRRHVP